MLNRSHALRLFPVLLASVLMAACSQSQVESADVSAADAGHADSHSSAGLPTGRIAAGEARAQVKSQATQQSCIDCHGAEGNAPIAPIYPRIGGQYGDYIAHALVAYRDGDRQHPLMAPQAANLSDQEIADLAAYFGSRPNHLRDLQGIK